ncbi:MAG: hypothetical protein KH828_10815 [Clostridiales bacterium]|nr:hypothetical protein [Clostridiales bacterium]
MIKKEHRRNENRLTRKEFLSGITKEDRIIPVITLVVYYGEDEWDGKIDLYGMMGLDEPNSIPEKIQKVLPNYKINLLHAGNIKGLENFKTDLQLVFGMLQYRQDKHKMREYINQNTKELNEMDNETCDVIGVLLHEEKRMTQYRTRERKETGMCKAFDEIFADERQEGRREAQREVIKKKLAKGKTIEEIADALEESKEKIMELMKQI